MRHFIISGLVVFLALSAGMKLDAATIFYKSGSGEKQALTKVKIVSISKGVMTIERDGTKRTISLSQLMEYSDSDITGGDSFEDNSADYTLTLVKVDMPKTGVVKTSAKQTTAPVAVCEIEYTINRKSEEGRDINRVKAPYFYLYVLADGGDEYNNSHFFRYSYPAEAKPGSDTFDEARITTAVQSLKRPTINLENVHALSTSKKSAMGFGDREVKIKLDKIKERRIVAYHLEVWGKSEVIAEKDWNEPGYAKDKKWWLKY